MQYVLLHKFYEAKFFYKLLLIEVWHTTARDRAL